MGKFLDKRTWTEEYYQKIIFDLKSQKVQKIKIIYSKQMKINSNKYL